MVGGLPDAFEWKKMKPFGIYCIAFVASLYCNMRALSQSTVETVIVFRACTPLAVSLVESMILKKRRPGGRSLYGLIVIVIGAILYVRNDKGFAIQGIQSYFWVSIYFVLVVFLMLFGKALIKDIKLTLSGNVLYTNALSLPLMIPFGLWMGELEALPKAEWTLAACVLLFVSCVAGTGIGYSSWWCRSVVSATTFTLIGVVNKVLTVFVNVLIWDKHATPAGIGSLLLCLYGAYIYTSSKKKETPKDALPSGNNEYGQGKS